MAEELGLKAGTPVAEGGVDAYVGALGLGVVEPGKMALITGSSHVMIGQTSEPIHDPGFWGAYTDAMIPGQYTVEAGQASTGSIVAWFKNQFAGDAAAEAKERGVDTYDVLTELARDVPIGSDGLIVLDYFQGNRSPYTDPLARGMMWGLTLSHTPGHVFRAIIEGICYGTENILRTMRGHDFEPRLNVVSGGPAKSDLWMQMHADVSNVPISFTKVSEGPVLGSAMLAAVGAGIYPDIQTAAEHMVHTGRHHRAGPGPPRGVPVLRGPLPGDLPADEGADAQDGTARRGRRNRGRSWPCPTWRRPVGGPQERASGRKHERQRIEAAAGGDRHREVTIGPGVLASVADVFRDASATARRSSSPTRTPSRSPARRSIGGWRRPGSAVGAVLVPREPTLYAEYGNIEKLWRRPGSTTHPGRRRLRDAERHRQARVPRVREALPVRRDRRVHGRVHGVRRVDREGRAQADADLPRAEGRSRRPRRPGARPAGYDGLRSTRTSWAR